MRASSASRPALSTWRSMCPEEYCEANIDDECGKAMKSYRARLRSPTKHFKVVQFQLVAKSRGLPWDGSESDWRNGNRLRRIGFVLPRYNLRLFYITLQSGEFN